MSLLDLVRAPKSRRKLDLKRMFVPVIFANGTDDDVPGLVAAFRNEDVQYEDRIYRTGEAISIKGKTIALSKGLCVIGRFHPVPEGYEHWVVVREAHPARPIEIHYCTIKLIGGPP